MARPVPETEQPQLRVQAKRIVEIDLGELDDAYDGQKITAWVNIPKNYLTRKTPDTEHLTDDERIKQHLSEIIVSHDLVDFDGQPYPPATDPAIWDALPDDLFAAIIQGIYSQTGKLSKTPGRTR